MRIVVADLWNSGRANGRFLIGAEDLDLHAPDLLSEIRQINPSLEVAIAHDIAAECRSAVAEQIDGPAGEDAQDAAKLVFLASLSQAVNPTLGLTRSEIAQYLTRPGRNVAALRDVIDALQTRAWYLHPTADGRLLFKNTENLVAKLDSYVQGMQREQAEGELRDRLKEMFKPVVGACYQQLLALPALDQVPLQQDTVTLVVFKPSPGVQDEVRRFWEHQQYRNRACFLTGGGHAFDTVLLRARELKAIKLILAEMRGEGRREDDPQLATAVDLETRKEGLFYQACRETFQSLLYPSRDALTPLEIDPKYVGNDYRGEEQVVGALHDAFKYRDDVGADGTFRSLVESKLWPQNAKEVPWGDLKRRAATDPSWVWHHPKALDALRDELVKRDVWRVNGTFVERGPFQQAAPTVSVQVLNRNDDTGETTIRVRPLHADTVLMSESGPPTPMSTRLETYDVTTRTARLWFLAVDSQDPARTGEPVSWANKVTIKYRRYSDGPDWRCELRAIPAGQIRFTTDGSSPDASGNMYAEPFVVPQGTRVILALAEADGVRSDVTKFDLPRDGRGGVEIDPHRPAIWRHLHQRDDTSRSYELLEAAGHQRARLAGVRLTVARDTRWVEFRSAADTPLDAATVIELANRLKEFVADGNLDLQVEAMHFESGLDLQSLVRDLKVELAPGELSQ
jgi:hypothetical protein